MTELQKLRAALLKAENPGKALKLADDYLLDLERKGEDFILPRAHAPLLPILEAFSEDLPGWVAFLKSVWKALEQGTERYDGVKKVFDSVEVRMYQQRIRRLAALARDVALRKGIIPDEPADKERYVKRCRKVWTDRKLLLLRNARTMSPKGRLSESHRAELLAEFWQQLEDELNNGEVPKP